MCEQNDQPEEADTAPPTPSRGRPAFTEEYDYLQCFYVAAWKLYVKRLWIQFHHEILGDKSVRTRAIWKTIYDSNADAQLPENGSPDERSQNLAFQLSSGILYSLLRTPLKQLNRQATSRNLKKLNRNTASLKQLNSKARRSYVDGIQVATYSHLSKYKRVTLLELFGVVFRELRAGQINGELPPVESGPQRWKLAKTIRETIVSRYYTNDTRAECIVEFDHEGRNIVYALSENLTPTLQGAHGFADEAAYAAWQNDVNPIAQIAAAAHGYVGFLYRLMPISIPLVLPRKSQKKIVAGAVQHFAVINPGYFSSINGQHNTLELRRGSHSTPLRNEGSLFARAAVENYFYRHFEIKSREIKKSTRGGWNWVPAFSRDYMVQKNFPALPDSRAFDGLADSSIKMSVFLHCLTFLAPEIISLEDARRQANSLGVPIKGEEANMKEMKDAGIGCDVRCFNPSADAGEKPKRVGAGDPYADALGG